MTATNICYNFVGFRCSPPLKVKPGATDVAFCRHCDSVLVRILFAALFCSYLSNLYIKQCAKSHLVTPTILAGLT